MGIGWAKRGLVCFGYGFSDFLDHCEPANAVIIVAFDLLVNFDGM